MISSCGASSCSILTTISIFCSILSCCDKPEKGKEVDGAASAGFINLGLGGSAGFWRAGAWFEKSLLDKEGGERFGVLGGFGEMERDCDGIASDLDEASNFFCTAKIAGFITTREREFASVDVELVIAAE